MAESARSGARWKRRLALLFAGLLPLGLGVLYLFWSWIVITIHPGQAGVKYHLFSGVDVRTVYTPGVHFVAPWNTLFVYETRKQLTTHELDVLTRRGLTVSLSLAIRHHPEFEQLGLLHQRIGPDYVRRAVLSQVEAALRRKLSRHTAEEIYTNKDNLLDEALTLARDEVGRNYIIAEDIVIRSIALPPPVKEAIESKLVQREILESYAFRLQTALAEADRKRREARGYADYNAAVDSTLTPDYLVFAGIRAARALATARNTSVVMVKPDAVRAVGETRALDASADPPRASPHPDSAPPATTERAAQAAQAGESAP